MNDRKTSRGRAVLAAVAVTAIVALLRVAIAPWVFGRITMLPFLASVLVAASLGGFWPGVLATVLGVLAGTYLFILPAGTLVPSDTTQWFGIVLYFIFGIAISATFEGLLRARGRAEEVGKAGRANEARLTTEADALSRLNEASSRLWRIRDLNAGLDEMLAASIRLLGADMGSLQLLDPGRRVLRVVAHRGFQKDFLDRFREVPIKDGSPWERVLRSRALALIEDADADADADALFTPLRPTARAAGYRAILSTPLIGRDGEPLGMLSTHWRSVHRPSEADLRLLDLFARQAVDFIERCELDRALREIDRRKDEFLAVMAHELRNPLAPIRNAAHFLGVLELSDPDAQRPLEMIERQVAHMTRLIDDLLDASRMTTGALQLRLRQVELNEVVHAALDASRAEIDSRAHEVRVRLPSPCVHLRADRDRLIQVLGNLIMNAAKYTDRHGAIDIDAQVAGNVLEIAVRDNGRGIARDQLANVFKLFVRVDRSLEGQPGLGIGLTLARQLVELHGGTIEASSDGLDRGSTFLVKLPVVSTANAAPTAPRPGRSATPRRVLLVDDSHDAAESLALVLETAGHETRVAFDGEAGLRAAAEFQPEVAILDIGMPKVNGYDLARRLRQQPWGKSIYLVALTGWGQEADQQRARDAGFDTHLVKPAALETIDRLLQGARDAVS